MSFVFIEASYENSIIELFQNNLGYDYVYGPDIERDFFVYLRKRGIRSKIITNYF